MKNGFIEYWFAWLSYQMSLSYGQQKTNRIWNRPVQMAIFVVIYRFLIQALRKKPYSICFWLTIQGLTHGPFAFKQQGIFSTFFNGNTGLALCGSIQKVGNKSCFTQRIPCVPLYKFLPENEHFLKQSLHICVFLIFGNVFSLSLEELTVTNASDSTAFAWDNNNGCTLISSKSMEMKKINKKNTWTNK